MTIDGRHAPRIATQACGRRPRLTRVPRAGYLSPPSDRRALDADNDRAADEMFPAAPDEETGRRQLEEITFEVCDSQRTATWPRRRGAVIRGVRRRSTCASTRAPSTSGGARRTHGTVWVTATPSRDRCFVVRIPVRPSSSVLATTPSPVPSSPAVTLSRLGRRFAGLSVGPTRGSTRPARWMVAVDRVASLPRSRAGTTRRTWRADEVCP